MADTFSQLDTQPGSVTRAPWVRRALLVVFAVIAALALLNRCGQRPAETTARVPAAAMTLSAPRAVRGGLFFQSRLEVRAARPIEHPRIVLAPGWVECMQVNSSEPAPVGETARDGRVVLSYDALQRGGLLRVWFQFEVNPTNVGRRSYAVELDDAEQPIGRLSPDITVWP